MLTAAGLISCTRPTPVPDQTSIRLASFSRVAFSNAGRTSSIVSPSSNRLVVSLRKARPSTPSGQSVVPRRASKASVRSVEAPVAASSAAFCDWLYRASGVRRNRVPRTAPAAPRARTAATWAPVVSPPAARTGGIDLHFESFGAGWRSRSKTSGRRQRRGGAWLFPWPPDSMPRFETNQSVFGIHMVVTNVRPDHQFEMSGQACGEEAKCERKAHPAPRGHRQPIHGQQRELLRQN